MPWTSPITWSPNQLVTAADLNAHLRDNMGYVHSGKPAVSIGLASGGPYSTSSPTLVDIDPTNLSATLSITASRVAMRFTGTFYADSDAGRLLTLAISTDGTSHYLGMEALSANARIITVQMDFIGYLSTGSHTLKMRWQVGVGTAFLFCSPSAPVRFSVWQI